MVDVPWMRPWIAAVLSWGVKETRLWGWKLRKPLSHSVALSARESVPAILTSSVTGREATYFGIEGLTAARVWAIPCARTGAAPAARSRQVLQTDANESVNDMGPPHGLGKCS